MPWTATLEPSHLKTIEHCAVNKKNAKKQTSAVFPASHAPAARDRTCL
jgi:hypothetical protein